MTTKLTAVLRHRDFALLWLGQSVSYAGDGIFTVALALEALRLDHQPGGLALVLAARLIPTVCLLLVGGMVVDRVPRRLAMLASDVVRGVAVGTIAVLRLQGDLHLSGLVVMSVVFGVADAFFTPAATALVPELLPAELLVQGNAASSTSQHFAQRLVGPAVGGVIVASIGASWSFGFDAATFAVSAVCLVAMRIRSVPAATGRSPLADAVEGLRYVCSQRWLWVTIVGSGLANFAAFSPGAVLVPLMVSQVLHGGALALGWVLAAGGVGAIVATVATGRRGQPRHQISAMWASWVLAGVVTLVVAVAPNLWVLGVLVGARFALLAYGNVLFTPLLQKLVPHQLLGRAASVDWLLSFGVSPIGILAAGALATAVGIRTTILVGGIVAVMSGPLLLLRGVRDPERQPALPDPAHPLQHSDGGDYQQGDRYQADHRSQPG